MFEKLSIKYNINFQKLVILLIVSSVLILGISIISLFVLDDTSEEETNIILNESENNIEYVKGDVQLYVMDVNNNIVGSLESEGEEFSIYETGSYEFVNSNTDEVVDSFVVSDSNILDISFDIEETDILQANNEIMFSVNETNNEAISYVWDFDDGSDVVKTNNEYINHEFESDGEYTVRLKAVDSNGDIDSYSKDIEIIADELVAIASVDDDTGYVGTDFTFDANDSLSTSNYAINSYNWYFGDGDESQNELSTHTYNQSGFYNVVLEVIDSSGASNTDTITIDVEDTDVNVEFESNKTNGFVDEYFEFNISSATTQGTNIDKIKWDFDDGKTKEGKYDVKHAFNESGEYNVNLTIIGEDGTEDSDSKIITVNDTFISASAYTNTTEIKVNNTFELNAANSTSEGIEVKEYNWDFNDNNTKTGKFVNHSFNETGNYEIDLEIVDEYGNKSTDSVNVTVTSGLNAVVDVDEKQKSVEEIFKFTGENSISGQTDIKSYEWNFGDNMTKEGKNVSYVYTEPEIYIVGLTIVGEDGTEDSETITVEVVE